MDPRKRADEALARARARGAFVVTPDNATSPMDAANTVRIPREMIGQADPADTTQVLPMNPGTGQYPQPHQTPAQQPPAQQPPVQQPPVQQPHWGQSQPDQHGWPTEDFGQHQQNLPPNPYQAQRGPNEFGPLGSRATQQQYPQY